MLSRILGVALVWSVAGMAGAGSASACSVVAPFPESEPPPPPSLKDSDIAIFGKVIEITPEEGGQLSDHQARVRVWRVYKGRVARTIRIRYTTDSGVCGTTFREGEVVALRLNRPQPYRVDAFSRESLRYLKDATGGRWHRPRPSS
jgi:hypothetical protein